MSLPCFTLNSPNRGEIAGKFSASPRLSVALAVLVMALVSLHGARARAQQTTAEPAAGPLPTVTYPARDPDTAPSPATAPQPAPTVIVVVPDTYYQVGDVWGYWDRERRFHRVPGDRGQAVSRQQSLPRSAIHLSNFAAGSIVGRPLTSHERGMVR